ncbi:hypothetical protein FOL47_004970 [Perkinsus chesapeaki]|uniref:Uncharacterized protein n=1 Tax=Perkinsus chesapeaki TaxID=330153 RepID=A0A7J6MYU4_PERCH|nr:hypothetical protein FOL47_004970 [Perkinsus chesapeaki]
MPITSTSSSSSSSFTSVDGEEDHFEFHPTNPRPTRPSGTSRRVSVLSAADLEEMARHSSDGSDFIDDRKEDDLTLNDWSASSASDSGSELSDEYVGSTRDSILSPIHSTTEWRKSGHTESGSSSGKSSIFDDRLVSSAPVSPLYPSSGKRVSGGPSPIGGGVVERKRSLFEDSEDDSASDNDNDVKHNDEKYFDESALQTAGVDAMDAVLDESRKGGYSTDENSSLAANMTKSPMVVKASQNNRLFDSFEGLEDSPPKDQVGKEENETDDEEVVVELNDSPVKSKTTGGSRRLKKGVRRSSATGSFLADQIRQSLSKGGVKKKESIEWGGAASLFSRRSDRRRSENRRSSSSSTVGRIVKAKEAKEEAMDEEGEIEDEYGYITDKKYARLPGGWKIERGKYDSLYDYQKDGVKWMYDLFKQGKGGVLADIMGMGKTVQVCALLRGLLKGNLATRVLILCEKSLRGLGCRAVHLGIAQLDYARKIALVLRYSACGDEVSDRAPWDIIIYDEAQKMRNPNTALFQHATLMRAKSKLLLTGTPIQNTPCDLWALMEIAVPGLLKDFSSFKNSVADVIKRGNRRGATELQEREKDHAVEELNALIYDYVLRREKYVDEITEGDVSKLEVILWIGLADKQLAIYKEYLNTRQVRRACSNGRDDRKGMHVLRCISTLRALCNHPIFLLPQEEQRWREAFGVSPDELGEGSAAQDDLDVNEGGSSSHDEGDDDPTWLVITIQGRDAALATYNSLIRQLPQDDGREIEALSSKLQVLHCLLRRLKEGGHRVLLFCPWTSMLDLVQFTILRTDGMPFLRIDGETSSHNRQRKIRKFQDSKKYFAFVLSTQCGNVGLNLTAADRVVLISPSWNPSDDDQAVARAYRIGQRRDVIAYRLVCSGTIEERIFQREVAKIGDSKVILESKDQEKYFSEVDLKRLFEYSDPTDSTAKDTLRDTADSASRTAMLDKLEDDLGGVASFKEQCDGMTIDFSDYGQLYKK